MITIEFECVLSAGINAFAVREEVCVWTELSKDGTIRKDLSLDAIDFTGDAHVNHLVEVVIKSAFIVFKVHIWACTSFACTRIAVFGYEATAFAPHQYFIDSATLAFTSRVTVKNFLA